MLECAHYGAMPAIRNGSLVTSPQAAEAMPDRSALRVVVVDDNYDANAAISKLLEKAGFDVAGRAYDGMSGLNVIKDTIPGCGNSRHRDACSRWL